MRTALSVLLLLSQLQAEPPASHVLEALAPVPASVLQEPVGNVVYADWAAGFASRGAELPAAWSALDPDTPLTPLALSYPPGAPVSIVSNINHADQYPNLLGIDLFQVNRSVQYGERTAPLLALSGAFDQEQVQGAFRARDYVVAAELAGGLFLCPAEGCDQGMIEKPENRHPADPFGGPFGRRQPVFVTQDHLISAASEEALLEAAHVMGGSGESLASLPEVRAALAAALSGAEHLLNFTVIDPRRFEPSQPPSLPAATGLAEEEAEAWLAQLAAQPLPRFALFAIAAVVGSGAEHGRAILVYGEQADAELAEAALETRLSMPVYARGRTFSEHWSDRGQLTAIRSEAAADIWTVTVQLSSPLEPEGRLGGTFHALEFDVLNGGHTLWVPGD